MMDVFQRIQQRVLPLVVEDIPSAQQALQDWIMMYRRKVMVLEAKQEEKAKSRKEEEEREKRRKEEEEEKRRKRWKEEEENRQRVWENKYYYRSTTNEHTVSSSSSSSSPPPPPPPPQAYPPSKPNDTMRIGIDIGCTDSRGSGMTHASTMKMTSGVRSQNLLEEKKNLYERNEDMVNEVREEVKTSQPAEWNMNQSCSTERQNDDPPGLLGGSLGGLLDCCIGKENRSNLQEDGLNNEQGQIQNRDVNMQNHSIEGK